MCARHANKLSKDEHARPHTSQLVGSSTRGVHVEVRVIGRNNVYVVGTRLIQPIRLETHTEAIPAALHGMQLILACHLVTDSAGNGIHDLGYIG